MPNGRRWNRFVWASPAIPGAAARTTDCLLRRSCGLSAPAVPMTSAVMLSPLSAWEYDQRPGLYARYFEACHNAGTEIATGRQALARNLGYRVLRVNASR